MKFFKRVIRNLILTAEQKTAPINQYYVTTLPCPQNALDIFKGEWSSKFPPPLDLLQAGEIGLFADARIQWLFSEVGTLNQKHILELGPLEGMHSYMLEQNGAESVTAIESNTHAFLRCLIAKELLQMHRVRFLCGDFIGYLKHPACPTFDLIMACGVLYHMTNPVELIALLAGHCRAQVFLWTHYYDETWAQAKDLKWKFPFSQPADYGGFSHRLVRQIYGTGALDWKGFCGGSRAYSHWLYREEILSALRHFGFSDLKIAFDTLEHPNGPSMAIIASRIGGA